MEHKFNIELAREIGVNQAIMFNHIVFLVQKNKANKKNFHENRIWTYNSIEAFCKIFPYWKKHQIRYILDSLEKSGLIMKGNFNENKYDRTSWYAIVDEEKHIPNFTENNVK